MALSLQLSLGLAMAMALSGCSIGASSDKKALLEDSVAALKEPRAANCAAKLTAPLIGLEVSAEAMEAIIKATGATYVQVLAPGQPMTRDFRPNRVRVLHDKDGFITAIMCG